MNAQSSTAGSPAQIIQLVLEGVDLVLNLLEGGSLGRDKQSPILGLGVAQESNFDAGRAVRGARPDVEFKGSEDVHEGSPIRWRLIIGCNRIHAEAWEEISSVGNW